MREHSFILLMSVSMFGIVELRCPDTIPCYLYHVQQCVAQSLDGQCPSEDVENLFYSENKEELELELEKLKVLLQDLSITEDPTFLSKWNGVKDCPDCNKPSCHCLHDLSSLGKLYLDYNPYSDKYKDLPDKLPMCDKHSRKIDRQGKPWCYVHRHSDCCGDNQQSSKYPHLDYSYQACEKPQVQAQAPCRKPCRCSSSPARGRCETPYKGEYWCYVDPEACCQRKVRSVRHKNLFWSTEPCNGVEINNLEERLTEDGFLTCQEDQECPPETPLQSPGRCSPRICYEEECECSPRDCFEGAYGRECRCRDERLCYPGYEGDNTSRITSAWGFCSNPCNTSTCYITPSKEGAAGAFSPVSLSSVTGVGYSRLAGQLVSTNGCPSRTLPCKCRQDPSRCCGPLWGGKRRGIFCPFKTG